jgi:hypothetical protein
VPSTRNWGAGASTPSATQLGRGYLRPNYKSRSVCQRRAGIPRGRILEVSSVGAKEAMGATSGPITENERRAQHGQVSC